MPATVFHPDDGLYNPDLLKMPENPRHRHAVDVIGLAVSTLLGSDAEIFRDMNWYPTDGGSAVAPDLMVLPVGAFVAPPDAGPDDKLNSYRQDKTGGPSAIVVVEIPSESDSYMALRAKIARYRRLGTVAYVVSVDEPQTIERFGPGPEESEAWITADTWHDEPIPELGGLRLRFDDGKLAVVMPDGTVAERDHELVAAAARRATQLANKAAALEQQLREAGIEPEELD